MSRKRKLQTPLPKVLLGEIVGYLDITCDVFFPQWQKTWEKPSRIERVPLVEEDGARGTKTLVNGHLPPLHDVPSIEKKDSYHGDVSKWYYRGKLHRDHDRPAVECSGQSKHWYQYGKRHRDQDRPAVEYLGPRHNEWYCRGQLHRDGDLPAVDSSNGYRQWYLRGQLHRDKGPAFIRPDGTMEWWLHGIRQFD